MARRKGSGVVEFPWAQQWPEITDAAVRAAFAAVPRAAFVPESLRRYAKRDAPLPIGEEQTISQPFVVALMTQALALSPGSRVLEVGTGSGFQTAILCELTAGVERPQGSHVYSIERYGSLSATAEHALHRLGYAPHLRVGDGAAGWPEAAPFDAIIVTAAPTWLPRPLWEQLGEGGRMVIPIGPEADRQILWLLTKCDGRMSAESLGPVRFVPLISPLLNDPSQRVKIAVAPGNRDANHGK
jgi:protein-L-isoaspartate(D-aspartate) O-methyltransferase